MHLCKGDDSIAKVMAESAMVFAKSTRGPCLAIDQDIARDPQHGSVYYTTVSVLAQAD
jgi:hypothetical protein